MLHNMVEEDCGYFDVVSCGSPFGANMSATTLTHAFDALFFFQSRGGGLTFTLPQVLISPANTTTGIIWESCKQFFY